MTDDVGHLSKCALPSILFSLGSGKREDGSNKKILPEHNAAEVEAREVQDGNPRAVGPALLYAVFSGPHWGPHISYTGWPPTGWKRVSIR